MEGFGERNEKRKCCLRGCGEYRNHSPFCGYHWERIPDDLQYRVELAYEDGSTMERYAAIQAASQYARA